MHAPSHQLGVRPIAALSTLHHTSRDSLGLVSLGGVRSQVPCWCILLLLLRRRLRLQERLGSVIARAGVGRELTVTPSPPLAARTQPPRPLLATPGLRA